MLNRIVTWTQKQQEQSQLQTRILTDPYYRFQSLAEVALAAALGVSIDVNQASVDDWLRLPGLSIHQAKQLVQLTHNGVQFYAIEDVAVALSLPVQRLQPLAAVMQFCYYDPESLALAPVMSLNAASVEQLLTIPGMMPSLAHSIIRDRITRGSFQNLADFQERLNLSGELTQ
ncbi:MAG: ComEA family DNA-binding protein [Acaryochloridaceae cyanobacterium CSU_3_4]|nr:ComEA family DNA-binding protein [Acaryochloridaceae cyanobacterium CSU_3_4]